MITRLLAVAALVVGAGTWVLTDHAVTLTVDGAARSMNTRAPDVATLLARAGLSVTPRDEVDPAPDTALADGVTVVVDRARPVVLTMDGVRREEWVTVRSVGELLGRLAVPPTAEVSVPPTAEIPLGGVTLDVRTRKSVVLVADGRRVPADTYVPTVGALLAERGVTLGERDRTSVPVDAALADGATVTVTRITVRRETETVTIEAEREERADADLFVDEERVVEEGRDGRVERTVEYLYADGTLVDEVVVAETVLTEARTRVVVVGTKEYPENSSGLNWAALAQCESGGNPRVVSSGGTYHGLYQFSVSTWERVGGSGLPSEATPAEQTYRAQVLYDRAGAGQWPTCGSRLFS